MNIVYMIVHIENLKQQKPPYYYIGSKYNWKGEGTYYGSSYHPEMKNANREDLEFHVIWDSPDCDKQLLVDLEKYIQMQLNVVQDDRFFNLSIANSRIYHPDCKEKAIESFKKTANSLAPDGRKLSQVWSEKGQSNLDIPDEAGVTRRQKASIKAKERLSVVLEDGRTVAQKIAEKTNKTRKIIGDDGLTLDQRKGKQLSEWLKSVDPETGKTQAYLRAEKNRKPVNVFGVDFKSGVEAYTYFSLSHSQVKEIYENGGTTRLYNKLCKMLGKEHVDSLGLTFRPVKKAKSIVICGESFPSIKEAIKTIGCPSTAFERYVKDGTMSKRIRECFIAYFGLEVFNMYYHED